MLRKSSYFRLPTMEPRLTRRTAYFSYGGLLMALRGSYRHLSKLVVGENIYLLIRK